MNDLSRLAIIAEIIGMLIVIGGLTFAMLQLRQIRRRRCELATNELIQFSGNPQFAAVCTMLQRWPDGMTAADFRVRGPVFEVASMANIGVMTIRRIVPFVVADKLMGVTTPVLWRKPDRWVVAPREKQRSAAAFEWFQWLAERLNACRPFDPRAACIAHRSWMSSHGPHRIGM